MNRSGNGEGSPPSPAPGVKPLSPFTRDQLGIGPLIEFFARTAVELAHVFTAAIPDDPTPRNRFAPTFADFPRPKRWPPRGRVSIGDLPPALPLWHTWEPYPLVPWGTRSLHRHKSRS